MTSSSTPDVMTSYSTPDVMTSYSTPDVSHLTTDDLEHVYEPAEDTFLLLDSLEQDVKLLREKRPCICLEVGTGSGMCITFLARMLGRDAAYFCTDINPRAAVVAMETARRNDVTVEAVVCDLIGPFLEKMAGKCDVILFNPPYVVTPSEEVGCSDLASSWAGGARGRDVTDRLFPHVTSLLSPGGLFYLLIIKENDEGDIKRLLGRQGLQCQVVLRRQSGPEFLAVLRFTKSSGG